MSRDFVGELGATVRLMRKYMSDCRPQSFAALYPTYLSQVRRLDLYGIARPESYRDINDYFDAEKCSRFGFTG